jgi:hypothetical protein
MKLSVRALPPALLLLSASVAFAAQPSFSREVCRYEGETDYGGTTAIETRYERAGDRLTVRTLVRFSASYLFFRVGYFIDEIDVMSADGRTRSLGLNVRYTLNDAIKRQKWDLFRFEWGAPNRARGFRIQGNKGDEFAKKYPQFARHWDTSAFGDDWLPDFDPSKPEIRPDLDSEGFTDRAASPLFVNFFKSRFLDPSQGAAEFEPFLGNGGAITERLKLVPQAGPGGAVTWTSDLYLGSLRSPEGKPTKLLVDPSTHSLKSIHIAVEHELGSAEGDVKLVGCE